VARLVRTLVAVDPALEVEDVAGSIPESEGVTIVGVYGDLDEARGKLKQNPFDLLVVASVGYSDRTLLLIDAAKQASPMHSVIVLSEGSSNGYVRRLLEAGADDILMLPQSRDQIRFAIQKLVARRETEDVTHGADVGRLVVVLGPKGGTGKTLTCANLAAALAQRGHTTAIVDIDLQFGDVALTMGLAPEQTLYDLARSGGTLDVEKLEHYLMRHNSGARALLAPSRPDQASVVTNELLRDVYSMLRISYEYVIVDTPPGFTAEVITTIDASTDLVMVGMLDSLSLKNTKLGLETLGLMGHDNASVKLVLNRAHSRVGITTSDVVAVLGREPDIYVPSDREIPRAVNEGVPIVLSRPDSEAAQAFGQLADLLIAGESEDEAAATPMETEPAAPRRRLFGRR
jgi:pilus assembly protein CpaE